jgi:glycosidase
MTKPIRSIPVLASAGLAAALAAIGYAIVIRIPSDQPESDMLRSPFQSALVNKQTIPGANPTAASKEEIKNWSGYTGKLGNDILYYIFVDRFYDGDRANNTPKVNAAINGSLATTQLEQKLSDTIYDPSHRLFGLYFGGDLEGVKKKLPYLAELGITKLVISPVQEGPPGFHIRQGANYYLDNGDGTKDQTNRSNLLANYHGYWIRDWFRLDPRMKSDTDPDSLNTLNKLLDEAQKFGIGIILDISLHHTSHVANQKTLAANSQVLNVFPALGEVRRRGRILANVNTKPDWYYPMCEMDYGRPTLRMLTTCQIAPGLPTLNHDNPIVRDYLLEAAKFWMKVNPGGAQVAGIRIDAFKHISPEFIRDLVKLTRTINPNAIIFAEDFGGGSQSTTTYDILNSAGDISTIDFDFTDSIRYYFSGDRSWTGNRTNVEASSLGDIKTQDLSSITPNWFANPAGILTGVQNSTPLFPINYPASKSWITSLETHDAPRMRTFRHQMTDSQYAAMIAFHFVARGVPMINYGAETGLSVPPLPRNNGLNGLGGDPFNRQMMIWPGQRGFNQYLFTTTKTFTRLRRENPVLRYGDTYFLRSTPDPWLARPLLMLRAYSKQNGQSDRKTAILYAFSPEGGTFNFSLPNGFKPAQKMCDIQTGQCLARMENGRNSIFLRPNKHRVFKITL